MLRNVVDEPPNSNLDAKASRLQYTFLENLKVIPIPVVPWEFAKRTNILYLLFLIKRSERS